MVPYHVHASIALSELPTTLHSTVYCISLTLPLKHTTSLAWNGSYHRHNGTSHTESSSNLAESVPPTTNPSNEEKDSEKSEEREGKKKKKRKSRIGDLEEEIGQREKVGLRKFLKQESIGRGDGRSEKR